MRGNEWNGKASKSFKSHKSTALLRRNIQPGGFEGKVLLARRIASRLSDANFIRNVKSAGTFHYIEKCTNVLGKM